MEKQTTLPIPENIRNYYSCRQDFVEIMERAKNSQPTTPTERRRLLEELIDLSLRTGNNFTNYLGRSLNWFNWVAVVGKIERLSELENELSSTK